MRYALTDESVELKQNSSSRHSCSAFWAPYLICEPRTRRRFSVNTALIQLASQINGYLPETTTELHDRHTYTTLRCKKQKDFRGRL